MLKAFFTEFLVTNNHKKLSYPLNEVENDIKGLCAVCPELFFEGKVFCFTGKFKGTSRNTLKAIVERNRGVFTKTLNKDTDYLVIGADGNPSWAFSCYGRKVEQAINYRKQGIRITISHEYDFWDAARELDD